MSEMSRLRWLCRRGMKELDVVMQRYLENSYETATAAEQERFRELLQMHPGLARFVRQLRIGPGQH